MGDALYMVVMEWDRTVDVGEAVEVTGHRGAHKGPFLWRVAPFLIAG